MSNLYHYGTPQDGYNSPTGSGRYRKGTGENPFQHETSLQRTIKRLEEKGITSEKDIATALGISINEFRKQKSLDTKELKKARDEYIFALVAEGYSNVAIAERIGRTEGYVRNRRKAQVQAKAQELDTAADLLRESLKEHKYIDVTAGTEVLLGIKKTKMDTAVQQLVNEGYVVDQIKVKQAANPDQYTTVKVLAPKGTTRADIFKERDQIGLVTNFYKDDGTRSIRGIKRPVSVDSKRVYINYDPDKDGVIELRRNVPDLDLGNKHYAQVRIGVDDTHYLKGMALYSDNIPDGYDIVFNTSKSKDVPVYGDKKSSVTKPMKTTKDGEIDWDNPFKSALKMEDGRIVGQKEYVDPKDGKTKLSPINIVREEGDWDKWSKTLASQFLAKQPKELISQQLNLTLLRQQNDLAQINAVQNDEVRRKLLNEFADECDSASVHLKAASLPRQSSKVILPLTEIKDTEIYAPTYRNGEKVALVRYPHQGTFEIPILTVNNRNKNGKAVIGGQSQDAVGINSTVAERLSGADFDGDSVTVIPVTGQNISSTDPLPGLDGFNPKTKYPYYEGMKEMTDTQMQMGIISNLITDMTIMGAKPEEIARATKHALVVIDAEKHRLDYKSSELDNGITELKRKYQGKASGGAATLLSRAKSPVYIDDRRKVGIDPETGAVIYENTGKKVRKSHKDPETGEWVSDEKDKQIKTTKMQLATDARELMSGPNHVGTPVERLYANYANQLKSMANEARKDAYVIETHKASRSAVETYADELKTINAKLEIALANKPLERMAQIIADVEIENAKKDYPELKTKEGKDDLKKLSNQLLAEARRRTGADKARSAVKLTAKEWEAIEAGVVSSSKLRTILANTDMDIVKSYAMPKESRELTVVQKRMITSYANANYDLSDIADAVGVSASTVSKYLNSKEGES